jgi:hypothetical protein
MLCRMRNVLSGKATLGLALVVTAGWSMSGQSPVDTALRFYSEGGWFCFRIVPVGVAPSKQTQWTMMVLTSKSNRKNTFKIEVGHSSKTGFALAAPGIAVADQVWRSDSARAEFFRKFADGISAGSLRARVVQVGPTNLGQLSSDTERAELYKRFAETGPNISFEQVPDLKAEEFMAHIDSFPVNRP